MPNHALGLVSVSFRQNSPEEILARMKKTPLSCIEWGSDIHAPYRDAGKLCEIVKLQREYGITCCSYGTYFRLGSDDVNDLEYYIDAAKKLGTNILRIWCGDRNRDLYSDEERRLFFRQAECAAKIAEKYSAVLCMECHNNSYTETLDGALEIMKIIDSPFFRMYWQPNQFKGVQTNIEYIKNIYPYVENIHVFNWEGNNKYPLCEADDVWRKYISFLDSPKNLLLEFMPDGRIETLEEEADSLCRIVEKEP